MQSLSQRIRELDHLLTVKEVAGLLRVSEESIYLAHNERIPHLRVGKVFRFNPQTLANWIDKRIVIGENPEGSFSANTEGALKRLRRYSPASSGFD